MENYKNIIWEQVEDGIGMLTLNRPQAYNAIDGDMLDELYRFWSARMDDLETAVIIMRGAGEKGFCSGLDIRWAIENNQQAGSPVVSYQFQAKLARLNLAMRRAPQPIISLVHGASVGVGFSIVLASDIRVISPDTRFCAGYINIGLEIGRAHV